MLLTFAGLMAAADKLPPGVPEGATETSPGIYRFVDKDKQVWVYRRTPFGYMRSSENATKETAPAASPRAADSTATPFGESKASASAPVTKATEDGDKIRFERPTPFGPVRWTRSKDELNEDEKKIWEAQRSKAGSNGANAAK
jgi:hypothetical protein